MIRVNIHPAPDGYERIRQRGLTWLRNHPERVPGRKGNGGRYWNQPFVKDALRNAFDGRCGYLAIWILTGEADHFIPISEDRSLAYEWSNLRYSDPRVNKLKSTNRLLDPYAIEDAWIDFSLFTWEVSFTSQFPQEFGVLGESTLRILNHPEVVRARKAVFECIVLNGSEYLSRESIPTMVSEETLRHLDFYAPLIGRAFRRYLDESAPPTAPDSAT